MATISPSPTPSRPTISAASKFTPSPSRRKILQERNEVVNPVSKSLEFPTKNEFDSTNFEFGAKSEMGYVNQEISKSFEAKGEDLEIKTHTNTSPLPKIASLDADPTVPPYDPKTNYLSPIPQFLQYKPNPRIEHDFTDVNDGKSLDDSFSSESSDVDYEKEQELESDESDESFHSEIEKIESDGLKFNSQCENATELSNCKNESKKSVKVPSFRRLGLVSFLLIIISLAFINVTLSDTPIMPNVMKMDSEHEVEYYETPLEVENEVTNEVENCKILTENAKEEQINEETYDTNTVIVYVFLYVLLLIGVCYLVYKDLSMADMERERVWKANQRARVRNANQNVASDPSEVGCSFDNTGRSHERRRRRDSTELLRLLPLCLMVVIVHMKLLSAKKGNREDETATRELGDQAESSN